MRLGQNFLIDERVASRQVKYANLKKDDVILEIGAGYGILTKKMAKIAKVIAIEIDERFIESLEKIPNVDVIHADALKIDFNELDFNKIVSNLPYQISSPITFKILESEFELAILMYQKEFAARLTARPGSKDYSRLTVMAHYKADFELLEEVPPEAFRPIPKVASCIVKVKPIGRRFDVDEKIFERVTKAIFMHRRKKIKNALALEGMPSHVPYGDYRAEQLSPEQIAYIAKFVSKHGLV